MRIKYIVLFCKNLPTLLLGLGFLFRDPCLPARGVRWRNEVSGPTPISGLDNNDSWKFASFEKLSTEGSCKTAVFSKDKFTTRMESRKVFKILGECMMLALVRLDQGLLNNDNENWSA